LKFDSVAELKLYKEKLKPENCNVRTIWVCGGPGCAANGSLELLELFNSIISKKANDTKNNFWQNIKASLMPEHEKNTNGFKTGLTGCMGPCEHGPVIYIEPEGWYYQNVSPDDAEMILRTLSNGEVYEKTLPKDITGKPVLVPTEKNIPFLAGQRKIILGRMKNTSPLDLDGYIKHGGYSALIKALEDIPPEVVCSMITDSGLRGRGGGGFPTGRKWEACRKSSAKKRYVLVNGDEGDPGAFMDRALMEGDPYSVLEGLTIGGYAIGSDTGIIYVRHEYPLAVVNLKNAINKLYEAGLLGENILGTGFSFNAEICQGGGAFVCGESTALMASVEGRPGIPRVKYIRSTEKGIWDSPTVLNNVETWANVPVIINNGVEWYKNIGTEKSPGTKVFALVGKVMNTGLVEIPMGLTLRQMIYDIGGGIAKKRPFKAVQTGGPSGGCLPESMLDTPVDFDSLDSAGSMMGSGGMIVMDDRTCMVEVARYFIDFLAEESCGKCTPCREGLKKMQVLLHDLTNGKGKEGDTAALKELAEAVSDTALCALGQSSANPVLSTIKYFPKEYEEHEKEHFCRAGVCSEMFDYQIIPDKCRSCGLCEKKCPADAVSKLESGKFEIILDKCIKCGICIEACPFASIEAVKEAAHNG